MRFIVDNGLPRRMASGLNAVGHDAVHVGDWGLALATDVEIFDRAASAGQVIMALDIDFGTILALRAATKPSVVLFRTQAKSVDALLPLFLDVLPRVAADLEAGAVVVIEDSRVRVRRLPIRVVGPAH